MNQSKAFSVFGQPAAISYLDVVALAFANNMITLPGLAIGTTANTKVKIVNAGQYIAGGAGGVLSAATEVAFTAGTAGFTGVHDILPSASSIQERVYMVQVAVGGAVTLVAGQQTTGALSAPLPERPANGFAPIGWVRIAVAAGALGFQGATTALNAAQLTVTYNDGYPLPNHIVAQ